MVTEPCRQCGKELKPTERYKAHRRPAPLCKICFMNEPTQTASPADPIPVDLNQLAARVYVANVKWWQDPHTGLPIQRNKGEMLALIHSEISEALEGERKDLMDDKLPHRKMAEVELVDAIIRILDYAGGFGYDLQGAFEEKMAYNAQRKDHQHAARLAAGGKQF